MLGGDEFLRRRMRDFLSKKETLRAENLIRFRKEKASIAVQSGFFFFLTLSSNSSARSVSFFFKKIGHSQLRRNSPAREDANRFVVATVAHLKRGKSIKTEVSGRRIASMCTPEKRKKRKDRGVRLPHRSHVHT